MDDGGDEDRGKVGKGKPPEGSRWRKGECGNPDSVPRRPLSDVEFILRRLRRRHTVIEAGEKARKTSFDIIYALLVRLDSVGHRRAARLLDRYDRFARAGLSEGGVVLQRVGEPQSMSQAPAPSDADALREASKTSSERPEASNLPNDDAPRDGGAPATPESGNTP